MGSLTIRFAVLGALVMAAGAIAPATHGQGLEGRITVRRGSWPDLASCRVVVVTAGVSQQPGETRLDHPIDPVGHSHHRSIWIGHRDVGGHNFWEDSSRAGRKTLGQTATSRHDIRTRDNATS